MVFLGMGKMRWLAIVFWFGLAISVKAQETITGDLQGQLIFQDDRDPALQTLVLDLADAEDSIEVVAAIMTDENGRFTFSSVPVGRNRVLLRLGEETYYYEHYHKPVLIE